MKLLTNLNQQNVEIIFSNNVKINNFSVELVFKGFSLMDNFLFLKTSI